VLGKSLVENPSGKTPGNENKKKKRKWSFANSFFGNFRENIYWLSGHFPELSTFNPLANPESTRVKPLPTLKV
jgi:hypothetical protein